MLEQVTFEQTILDSAREVFETMIFMDIETTSSMDFSVDTPLLMGSIGFKGTLEGYLAICLPIDTARVVAGNMLALDSTEDLPERDICDAVGEVCNMTMGSIKHRLLSTYPEMQVSIPIVVTGRLLNNNNSDHFQSNEIRAVLDEQLPVTITLFYRNAEAR